MIDFLQTYGIEIDSKQALLLEAHLRFVLEKNQAVNLTRITDYDRALILHVLDSLLVLPEVKDAPDGALIDIGTGAGYPGLPLAIVTQRQTTLLDAREKKIMTIKEFFSLHPELNFCEAISKRAEEFALERQAGYSVVVARALAALPTLVELASPLLPIGGHLIALKGQPQPDEIARSGQLEGATGLAVSGQRTYSLPSGERREVIVYEKIKHAQLELPRRVGLAQRKPLA
ncbi:MAG: 16S rRNA (guanine(527)-N(7))-methyltransferase RsmG [Coriobacteriia bacterium]|nr:16S rRNA (guanine(527)-N(7))-methyltransferase RsmG [Coriobacteriia bacterium]